MVLADFVLCVLFLVLACVWYRTRVHRLVLFSTLGAFVGLVVALSMAAAGSLSQ